MASNHRYRKVVEGRRYEVKGLKRGLCVGNLLLSTFYFLLVSLRGRREPLSLHNRGKITIFSVLNFPLSFFHEFRGFRAVGRHDLQDVDAGGQGGGVDDLL